MRVLQTLEKLIENMAQALLATMMGKAVRGLTACIRLEK